MLNKILVKNNSVAKSKVYYSEDMDEFYTDSDKPLETELLEIPIVVRKMGWQQVKVVQEKSTTYSMLGVGITSPETRVENTIKYGLKEIEGYDIKFETDKDNGFEFIGDAQWLEMSSAGEEIFPPAFFIALYKAIKAKNGEAV